MRKNDETAGVSPAALAVLLAALLCATPSVAATPSGPVSPAGLGPHGGLVPGDARGCSACHDGEPAIVGFGERRFLDVPPGGHLPLGEPVARSCWLCHRPGNPYGARSLGGRSLAVGAHGIVRGETARPDSWAEGAALREGRGGGTLPHSQTNVLACTSCHDVHDHATALFLRKTTATGDFTGLCADCHPGRENPGLVGADNIFALVAVPYSTHPSGASGLAPLPCGTCHDAHGAPPETGAANRGLLRLNPGEQTADLCARCHTVPGDDATAHPPGRSAGRGPYPAAFASSDGIPRAWKAGAHFDSGADAFVVGARQTPRCTSCHDLHGALPMGGLLFGPNTVDGGAGDWCFNCHPAGAVTPPDHETRAPGAAGRECRDCHGSVDPDGRRSWRAHRDFRRVAAAAADPPPPPAGTPAERQRQAVTERLLLALRDERPFARENAVRTLIALRPPEALEAALAALGDPRPDVREKALQVLGAIGDKRVAESLAALAGSPKPELRRAAAEALGNVGGERVTPALLPLLRDPVPEVRLSAVRAFSGVRDPRIYPPLAELLRGSDEELRTAVGEMLSRIDDARVLEVLLRDAANIPGPAPVLLAVIRRLHDPAGTPQLLEALRFDHRLVRIAAAAALRQHPGPVVVDALIAALESPDERLRGTIVESLAVIGDPRAAGALLAILTEPRETVPMRRRAIAALGKAPTPAAVPALIDALGDPEPVLQFEASRVLVALTCENFGQESARWREWWGIQPPRFPLGSCR